MRRLAVMLFFQFLALALLASPASGQGGMPLIIADDDRIVDTNDDVLIAKVVGVSTHKATRANPPRVALHVEMTLRGPKHNQLQANWDYPYDPEGDNPDGPKITPETRAEMRRFANEPLDNPKVGEEWVIIGENAFDENGTRKPDLFWISAKFPLTKDRLKWADVQLRLRKQYDAERIEYCDRWPKGQSFVGNAIPDGAQPVEATTDLRPGMQLLLKWATTTPCSVIAVQKDGQVQVRPHGYDSRRDVTVPRDKLVLNPASQIDSR